MDIMKFTTKDLEIWETTATKLSGKDKRMFMAQVVERLGYGGQSFVEKEFGWCRETVRKGRRECNGEKVEGDLSARGRKKSEVHLPYLLEDIKSIVEPISQTDPSFRTDQLYSPITANEVHRRLIEDKGYQAEELPCVRTISNKLKNLGFRLRRVQKSKPLKKNP